MMDNMARDLSECFATAKKCEEKGIKHKGLLKINPNQIKALEYLKKAEDSLLLCKYYKENRFDYKLPEEWYYCMYYCSLAILYKFGVESRSQRCTALLIQYLKSKSMIEIEDDFIDRIMVHKEKDRYSDVDKREDARYGSWRRDDKLLENYDFMAEKCRNFIEQTKEIIYSNSKFEMPEELL